MEQEIIADKINGVLQGKKNTSFILGVRTGLKTSKQDKRS